MNLQFPYKLLQAYEAYCKPLCREIRIPQTAFDILMFLANNPDWNTARDIVEIRGIKANLVSVNVDRLVREGYLERKSVPNDRRKKYLVCTDKAQSIVLQGRDVQSLFIKKLFEHVNEQSKAEFQKVLHAVEKNLTQMMKEVA